MVRKASPVAVLFVGTLAVCGCNAIFGITSGKGAGGTSTTTSAGGGGAGGDPGCPPEKPATCDPKYADDGNNCCVAGRNCGDAECVDGECAAALIVDGKILDHNGDCIALAVAGDQLFWTTGGNSGLYRTDLDGDGKVTFDVPGSVPMEATTRIAAEPGASPEVVYFTDWAGATIGRLPTSGGDIESFATAASNQARYGNILVHGDFVYWAMQKEDKDPNAGEDVWRAKRQPIGTASVTAERVVVAQRPLGLAADDAYLYYDDSATQTIYRIPWSALGEGAGLPATPEALVTDAGLSVDSDLAEMAVDDEYLYWGFENTIWAVKKATPGAQKKSIGQTASYVGVILADGRDVYYATLGGTNTPAEVYRAPKGGEGAFPKKLFQAELAPDGSGEMISSLAQDCGHLYVLVRSECDVYKLTK